jgi:hypothetical protein
VSGIVWIMTTQNTPNTNDSTIILAGAAADGHGALAGWRGQGRVERATLLAALAEAGLPESWAPRSKSAVGHAGAVVDRCSHSGLIARRARGAAWERPPAGGRRRDYAARWVVAVNQAAAGRIGASVGTVAVVAELRDGSDDLHVTHDEHPDFAALADRIRAEYRAARDAEAYDSHDVTDWLRAVLVRECGAARFGSCLYVPAHGRDVAERLCAALSARWGVEWIAPLLPVATSSQLSAGLARGLDQDAAAVEADLASERAAARAKQRTEVSPTVAVRLLGLASAVADRCDRYEPLCGAPALAPVRARLAALRSELDRLADSTSVRGSLIEMDGAPTKAAARVSTRPASAVAAADRALDARRAEQAAPAAEEVLPPGWMPPGVVTWVAELAAHEAAQAAPVPARTVTEALVAATADLDEGCDAGRLVRRVVAQLAAGEVTEEQVRPRLQAMTGERWAPVAAQVLALLDAPAARAA